ncbi:hypothetical protein GDO81_014325 [Engystomops pustulosus]|uniref:Testis-expressed protein 12 n=1 Tax=Engystomops pustulosus TaxID=76066 RepID=A0AAV7B9N3_ENGPU|nr:hypothetical protein GDO81_014325 [Engystomops pustulosus]KAG8569262.1 hypothetical protein GDO81_014325 [Engystomops pustulosus]
MEKMSSSTAKHESKTIKRKIDKENMDPEHAQCMPPPSRPSPLSDNHQVENFELMMKDLSKEVNLLFSNYAKTLGESSALDVLHVHMFDEILKEARSLETQLRQKKEDLRNHLTMLAKALQR